MNSVPGYWKNWLIVINIFGNLWRESEILKEWKLGTHLHFLRERRILFFILNKRKTVLPNVKFLFSLDRTKRNRLSVQQGKTVKHQSISKSINQINKKPPQTLMLKGCLFVETGCLERFWELHSGTLLRLG